MKLAFLIVVLVTTIAWRPSKGSSFDEEVDVNEEEFSESVHERVRRETLVCGAGQTKIYTPFIYVDNVGTLQYCANIKSAVANDYYNVVYRTECQRWLGLAALPAQVGLSEMVSCSVNSFNFTAVYQMAVCCTGVTSAVRCFSRPGPDLLETDNYGTNYHGAVETCAANQLCQTQYTFQGSACTVSKRYVTKGCVSASDCLTATSSPLCADFATTPVCTTCCNSTFCNFNVNETLTKKPGSCSSGGTTAPKTCSPNPCNGGTCQKNPSTGKFECSCRIGYTGLYCNEQRPLCSGTTNPCENGGTCFNYGNGQYRCYCPMGLYGETCQYRTSLTCQPGDLAYYVQPTESPYPNNCDTTAFQTTSDTTAYLAGCSAQMKPANRPEFVNTVNGQINEIYQIETKYCRHGDYYSYYVLQMCCPACFSVPCLNGGWCNDVKETNGYVCSCPVGFTGVNCEHMVSLCIVSGEPHIKTFDKQKVNYQGICKQLLVEPSSSYTGPNTFEVYMRNEYRNGNQEVSFPKDLIINLCGDEVQLLGGQTSAPRVPVRAKVNGVVVTLPYRGPCYTIDYSSNFVSLDSNYGLSVQFDGNWLVVIQVPDDYQSLTHGLCGNNNGNADDDFTLSNGTYVGNLTDPGSYIGNSYVVPDGNDTDLNPCYVPPHDDTCPPADLVINQQHCNPIIDPLGIFSACIARLGADLAEVFYDNCVFDACFFNQNSTCLSLAVFAHQCFQVGVTVQWRGPLNCPLNCPVDMVASDSASACQPTCDNPTADLFCPHPNSEGCVCPEGQILFEGHCRACCGSYESDGTVRQAGETWMAPNCSVFTNEPTTFDPNSMPHCTSSIVHVSDGCNPDEMCYSGQCIKTTTTSTTTTTTTPTTTTTTPTTTTTTPTTTTPTTTTTTPTTTTSGTTTTTPTTTTTTPTTTTTTPTTTTTTPTTTRPPAPQCLSINGGFCEYSPWGDCINFNQVRTRSCGCPQPGCYACNVTTPTLSGCVNCVQTLDDGTVIPCPAQQCSGPTTESRYCCPPFDPSVGCQTCDFTMNPLGYVADPCNGTYFYQCAWVNNGWTAYHMPCPKCLAWSPLTLTCSDLANPTVPLTDPRCAPENTTGATRDDYCTMFFPASDPTQYIWVTGSANYLMPCPAGTLFDAVSCRCLQSSLTNSTGRLFCLDFDNSYLLNGLFTSMANIQVDYYSWYPMPNRGRSAYFNGNGAWIEVPALSNAQFNKFGISLWFKRVGTDTSPKGLVYNGDCRQFGSIRIQSSDQTHVAVKVSTIYQNVTIPLKSAPYNTWNHVALSYDGTFLRLYVNNVLVSTNSATGPTVLAGCPLTFGHNFLLDMIGQSAGWFNGYMDEMCFYNKAFTSSQVNDLFNHIMA